MQILLFVTDVLSILTECLIAPNGEGNVSHSNETHSSIFAWEIPRTEEPGRLQSTKSQALDVIQWLNNQWSPVNRFLLQLAFSRCIQLAVQRFPLSEL